MNILLTIHPGMGHLHPLTPLAQALGQVGHHAVFACSPSFAPYVEAAGLHAAPVGLDWLESRAEEAFPEMKTMSPSEQMGFFTDIFTDMAANPMTDAVLQLCKTWRPDVIVRESSEYSGCIAAECLGIPHVTVGIELYMPTYMTRIILEEPLAYLRSAYGLTPYPAMEMLDRYLYLSLFPPSYQFPEYHLPPNQCALQPLHAMPAPNVPRPDWLARMPDQPTVYVSMGTVLHDADVFKIILDGISGEAINLIMTIGQAQDPAQFGPQPENIHIEQFIPHAVDLLPYCAAAITHGGASTTLSVLSQGLPIIIVPFSGHSLMHGMRCEALGVGVTLIPPTWSLEAAGDVGASHRALAAVGEMPRLQAETVRDRIRSLLEQPSYSQAAQRLKAEIDSLPGPEYAVTLLENLVKSDATRS